MAIEDWLQGKKGLASLLPGKGGERMKPLPPGFKRFLQQPPTLRPPIEEPGGPRPPRPPGISLAALKRKRQQLREQLRQIEAQIRSLGSGRRWDEFDFGPEPPMPTIPWDPQPIGPPTMPGPISPPSMPAPTPVGPPTMPPRPIPPWGG